MRREKPEERCEERRQEEGKELGRKEERKRKEVGGEERKRKEGGGEEINMVDAGEMCRCKNLSDCDRNSRSHIKCERWVRKESVTLSHHC